MRITCILAALLFWPSAGQWAVLSVSPWPLPTNANVEITVVLTRPLQITSTTLEHWVPQASGVSTLSSGGTADHSYSLTNLGKQATVTLNAAANRGLGSIRIAPGSTPFPLRYYSPPTFAPASAGGLVPTSVNSTGLVPVKLRLLDQTQSLPTSSLSILSVCHAAGTTLPALITDFPVRLGGVPALTVIIQDVTVDLETLGSDTVTNVNFLAPSVTISCGNQALYASYNGGSHYHNTGLVLLTVPRPPVKVVSLYPFKIANSPWVTAHNDARMRLASRALTAADTRVYYEESWRMPALPSGDLIDLSYFERAINTDNASVVVLAGTQYNATLYSIVDKYPQVNFLMMSTKRHVLPYRDNVAYATGRMYEAIFYAGYIAASVSKTGYFGFIMNLFDPGSFAITNAFKLGIDACVEAGQAGFVPQPNAAVPSPRVFGRIIGAHSDDWAEQNAALELVYPDKYGPHPNNPPVDIIFPVTDNASPQLVCHQRPTTARGGPCYSFGFNADERATLGDFVLSSLIFNILPVYLEFIGRVVSGKTFGQSTFDAGLGLGVDLSPMSPVVPLDIQAEVARRMDDSRAGGDTLEEVFCAKPTRPLVDRDGVVLLYGNGTVAPGLSPALLGEHGFWCLQRPDIYRHQRLGQFIILQGVDNPGVVYQAPPQPSPEHYDLADEDPGVYFAALLLGAIIVATSLASALMVCMYRKHDVIRFSSPVFLVIICAGGAVTGAGILYHAIVPNDQATQTYCVMRLWLEGIGFILLYGSLFAKTYRVHRLFNNHKLKRLKLNVWYVVRIVATLLAMEVAVLITLTVLSQPQPETVVIKGWTSNPLGISHVECASEVGAADTDTVLQALHFVLLLWGAYLAYSTRNVPLGFNESRYIGLSIYNIVVATIIGFAIAAGNHSRPSPSLSYTVNLIHMAVPAAATLLLLFVPKALELAATSYRGQEGSGRKGATGASTSTWWLCCGSAIVRCAKACVGDPNKSKVGVMGGVTSNSTDETPTVTGNSKVAVQGGSSYIGGSVEGGTTVVVSAKSRTKSSRQAESMHSPGNSSNGGGSVTVLVPVPELTIGQERKEGRQGRDEKTGKLTAPMDGITVTANADLASSSSSSTSEHTVHATNGGMATGREGAPSSPAGPGSGRMSANGSKTGGPLPLSSQQSSEGTGNPASLGGSFEQQLQRSGVNNLQEHDPSIVMGAVPRSPVHTTARQQASRHASMDGHEVADVSGRVETELIHAHVLHQIAQGGAITFDGGGVDEQDEEGGQIRAK